MKKSLFLSILLALFLVGCNAQTNMESAKTIRRDQTIEKERNTEPKEEVIVNKEYDDDGNLIRYDSTYSTFYSNIEGNPMLEDSIFNQFKVLLSENPFFDDFLLKSDDKIMDDFYTNDFFSNHFRKQLQEMDSIKNLFFEQQFSKKLEKL